MTLPSDPRFPIANEKTTSLTTRLYELWRELTNAINNMRTEPLEYQANSYGLIGGKSARMVYILGRRDQGWTGTSVLGDVCQYLDTSQALMNTPTTGQTLYVVSTDGNDAAAGTGARTVRVVYLDSSGNQQRVSATLNGTTAVSIGTGFAFIQWMEVLTVGSGGVCAGNVTVSSTNGVATVATTFEYIKAGGNRSLSCRYKVPTGFSAYLHSWKAEAISANMDTRLRADVTADDRVLSAGVFHFQSTTYLPSGTTGPADPELDYLCCPAGSVIKASAIPSSAPAGNRCDVSFDLLLIAN